MGIFETEAARLTTNAVDSLRAADGALLADAVLAAVGRGWLLSFGRSRDGYAASIAVLDGGSTSRVWCEDAASVERALARVLEAATDVSATVARAKPKKAPRAI